MGMSGNDIRNSSALVTLCYETETEAERINLLSSRSLLLPKYNIGHWISGRMID